MYENTWSLSAIIVLPAASTIGKKLSAPPVIPFPARKPGDPNYHLFKKALISTSKRIYPNYANCDWSNQKAWKKADIDVKEKVIGELNEFEKNTLIDRLNNNKALAEKLSILSFDNGNIIIDVEEKPYEYFGTMGK